MKKLLIMVGVLVFLFVGYAGAEPYDICIDNPFLPMCEKRDGDGAKSIGSSNNHGDNYGSEGVGGGGNDGGNDGGSRSGLRDGTNPGQGDGGPHGEGISVGGSGRGKSSVSPGHTGIENPSQIHGKGGHK